MNVLKTLDELIVELSGPMYGCTRQKFGKVCTQQHDGADKNGLVKFYFSTGCKVVETFCPACLAYWHVAVARNCLITYRRQCAAMVADDARKEQE